MQFKVPQFIEIEDKLFGSFSFRQFVYMVGGGGMIYVIYKVLPLWIGIFIILPIGLLTFLLVFYKINEKPFAYYLQAAASYAVSSKLYIWKQRIVKNSEKNGGEAPIVPSTSMIPQTRTSSLKDLSWSLDVQEKEGGQ